ncbi:MAG: hypothetical protein JW967_08815 [Dehalococcoidales bacterium]|nr:hypothetical protein [Dehalococcoidales bacterium]
MTEEKRRHGNSSAFIWGIILIFAGVVLLLQTFNILPWSLWGTLWRFWPAIIIIIGLVILLRHTNAWLVSLLTVAILGGCLGIAIWQHGVGDIPRNITTQNYELPIDNLQSAEVNINFDAGKLIIGNISSGETNLVEAKTEIKNSIPSLTTDYDQLGTKGSLYLKSINQQNWPDSGITWKVNISEVIPIDLTIDAAASTIKLYLDNLNLSSIYIDIDASSCELNLPTPDGMLNTVVKANAATVNITIPEEVAARIQATSNVATLHISSRFFKNGDYYVTDNYDIATDRIELTINTSVGTVSIK